MKNFFKFLLLLTLLTISMIVSTPLDAQYGPPEWEYSNVKNTPEGSVQFYTLQPVADITSVQWVEVWEGSYVIYNERMWPISEFLVVVAKSKDPDLHITDSSVPALFETIYYMDHSDRVTPDQAKAAVIEALGTFCHVHICVHPE
jgi:hypothetical protein